MMRPKSADRRRLARSRAHTPCIIIIVYTDGSVSESLTERTSWGVRYVTTYSYTYTSPTSVGVDKIYGCVYIQKYICRYLSR